MTVNISKLLEFRKDLERMLCYNMSVRTIAEGRQTWRF